MDDAGVVGAAVSANGRAIVYANRRFFRSKDMALRAVRGHWKALEILVDRVGTWDDDFDVMEAACRQNGAALRLASKRLRGDVGKKREQRVVVVLLEWTVSSVHLLNVSRGSAHQYAVY